MRRENLTNVLEHIAEQQILSAGESWSVENLRSCSTCTVKEKVSIVLVKIFRKRLSKRPPGLERGKSVIGMIHLRCGTCGTSCRSSTLERNGKYVIFWGSVDKAG